MFLGFYFLLENFSVGQDGTKRCNTSCVEGMGGLSMPQVEVGGGSPWEFFFANLSSEKGIFRAILKAPWKKAK